MKKLVFVMRFIFIGGFVLNVCQVVKSEWIRSESNLKMEKCRENIPISASGKAVLQFNEECEEQDIEFGLKNKTSILNLNAATAFKENPAEPGSFDQQKKSLRITIYETTVLQNDKYVLVPLKNWQLTSVEENIRWNSENYLSRTSVVFVKVMLSGDWTNHNLVFYYEEIPYDTVEKSFSDDSGTIQSDVNFRGQYRPNTVFLHRLNEGQLLDRDKVLITLEYLDVDITVGEYMIIGAGTRPFQGPKPIFISQPVSNSTYYVQDSSAYIILVSSSTQTLRSGFRIYWKHTGSKQPEDDTTMEDPLNTLKSKEICFYNVSSEDCNQSNNGGIFSKFREKFVEIAKNYTASKRHKDKEKFQILNSSSVILYHIGDCSKTSFVKTIVQIKYKGRSLLTWEQLGDVISIFENKHPADSIGQCPSSAVYDTKTWGFFIYLSVPVFGLFFLTLWAWRQNVFKQCCTLQKENDFCIQHSKIAVESNFYASTVTVPKLVETDEQGRRRTLIAQNSDSTNEEYEQNEANMVDSTSLPSTFECQKRTNHLSFPRDKQRPSIHSLIEENELNKEQSYVLKIQKNETEHLYNSVSSAKRIEDTKL